MNTLITLFWLADVMNLPFMEIFDTTIPINGWYWFFAWLLIPTAHCVKIIGKD